MGVIALIGSIVMIAALEISKNYVSEEVLFFLDIMCIITTAYLLLVYLITNKLMNGDKND